MDDTVVKSRKGFDLLTKLAKTFANLHAFGIKLNLAMCTFGVSSSKLLGSSFLNVGPTQILTRLGQLSG